MSDSAYGARILTFAPDGRIVDASRGTFEPETLRVATGPAGARPYADLSDVPVARVYLGVQPGASGDGASAALATATPGASDRSFIVIERENGFKQVIETQPVAAREAGGVATADALVDANVASSDLRGTPRGVAAETDLGAFLSPEAVTVDLTAPSSADRSATGDLTRYANDLIERSQVPSATDRAESWSSSLVREAGGSAGAADVERVTARLEAHRAETASSQTPGDATPQTPRDATPRDATPQMPRDATPQTQSGAGGDGRGEPAPAKGAEPERSLEPKPDVTPVDLPQAGARVERGGREVVGTRPASDRAADARLDGLKVKYNQYDVNETVASERATHVSAERMAYVRAGEAAVARPGYQQDGRIVGMTADTVTQDIGQGKVAVYGTQGLIDASTDPAAVQSTLARAAASGSSVELNFSRGGGLSVTELGQTQNRALGQDQDRGMGRSLF